MYYNITLRMRKRERERAER